MPPRKKPEGPKPRDSWLKEYLEDKERADGYKNELTGIGNWMRDKTLGGKEGGPDFITRFLSNYECEVRWRGSDLGARIVETVPDEMTRQGWELTCQDEEEEEAGEEKETDPPDAAGDLASVAEYPQAKAEKKDAVGNPFQGPHAPTLSAEPPETKPLPDFSDDFQEVYEQMEGKLDELCFDHALWEALCYERAFGGGAILLGAQDGTRDLTRPLSEKNVKDISWVNSFAGGRNGEIIAWKYYDDPRSPKYGWPEIYAIQNLATTFGSAVPGQAVPRPKSPDQNQFFVHESRVLTFPGVAVSRRARVENRGWGDSIFSRVDEVLSQYNQTWGGIANLMTDFSQGVLKVEGLAKALAGGNQATRGSVLTTRARQLDMARSISRILLVDATEDFRRDTASLGGISDVLEQFALRLAAAADMPVTLLMGQSPAGLNATGASDVRFFYDRIAAKQKRRLLPQLKRMLKLLFLCKEGPTEGEEPAKWFIQFNPLYQMTELEQAQLRKLVAETDKIYMDSQVLTPEEVTASAFGGSEWTMERQVDVEGRDELVKQEQKDKEARMKLMSESAKAGVNPEALALNHPENPRNLPLGKSEKETLQAKQKKKSDADWNEEDHPREENGRFASGGGGGSPAKEVHLDPSLSAKLPGPHTVAGHIAIARQTIAPHAETFKAELANLEKIAPEGSKVYGRVKEVKSAVEKVARKPAEYPTVANMTDLTGTTIELGHAKDLEKTIAAVRANYQIVSEDNYNDKPTGAGYRAHHFIVKGLGGVSKEVQIHTPRQAAWKAWYHDVYKADTPAQKTWLKSETNREAMTRFGVQLSEHFASLDKGMSSPRPAMPSALKGAPFKEPPGD